MKYPYIRAIDISRLKHIFKWYDELMSDIGNNSIEEIKKDNVLVKAIKMDLLQIGEHVHHLPSQIKSCLTPAELGSIVSLRNQITHTYEVVDFDTIFNTLKDLITPGINKLKKLAKIYKL